MLKKYLLILLLSNLFSTFSIVAIDTETGEVGSAGGSCIAGSIIISDIHPGVGAIHTQSYYLPANQSYASTLMNQGYSPNEIIEILQTNDIIFYMVINLIIQHDLRTAALQHTILQ